MLGMVRSEMGSTARGAGRSGAQHAMAVNETALAFILGGSAPGWVLPALQDDPASAGS
ncbi:hypothetical protein GCM10010502_61850 [Kitasatospora aureofaciens]|uniref:Uncharacterized protein n=1 Tax=Kitasatospora aureofaciens TaxID=1894 RepID=A0A8H9I042_KITAU|nr:hypothetical protein GCM10010502_61850 [Kitasatospora aureofaciens]